MEIGPVPAGNGEPDTWVSIPLGLEHVVFTCMQAANALTLFDPEFATKRMFPSAPV